MEDYIILYSSDVDILSTSIKEPTIPYHSHVKIADETGISRENALNYKVYIWL